MRQAQRLQPEVVNVRPMETVKSMKSLLIFSKENKLYEVKSSTFTLSEDIRAMKSSISSLDEHLRKLNTLYDALKQGNEIT